jgi:predicted nucleic acid-binding protein
MPDGDRRRVVVVNSTPIITLALLDRLDLLQSLYGGVLIPSAVEREIRSGGPERPGAPQLGSASWVEAVSLEDPSRADLLSDLDRGEAEVIALALEQRADLVVIDERLGRRHARRLGLPLTGTLGILLKAKGQGLIPQLAPALATIRRGGIRLADQLVTRVLELAGENDWSRWWAGAHPTEAR